MWKYTLKVSLLLVINVEKFAGPVTLSVCITQGIAKNNIVS